MRHKPAPEHSLQHVVGGAADFTVRVADFTVRVADLDRGVGRVVAREWTMVDGKSNKRRFTKRQAWHQCEVNVIMLELSYDHGKDGMGATPTRLFCSI